MIPLAHIHDQAPAQPGSALPDRPLKPMQFVAHAIISMRGDAKRFEPRGTGLIAMLDAMRKNGPMSTAALGRVAGIETERVCTALRAARASGLVRSAGKIGRHTAWRVVG